MGYTRIEPIPGGAPSSEALRRGGMPTTWSPATSVWLPSTASSVSRRRSMPSSPSMPMLRTTRSIPVFSRTSSQSASSWDSTSTRIGTRITMETSNENTITLLHSLRVRLCRLIFYKNRLIAPSPPVTGREVYRKE